MTTTTQERKMKQEIRNRWSGNVQFTAEIEADENTPLGVKVGLAVKWAFSSDADLSGAVLSDAVLSGADLRGADLRGADLRDAVLRDADLRDADLRDADLSGAVLRDAVLRDAVLRDADLSGAVLSDADLRGVPKIEKIHQRIFDAVTADPAKFDMTTWHSSCGTTHCRAGWVVTLAGEAGKAMEFCIGTGPAAAMIYMASDPKLEKIPNWVASNQDALDDMKRLAEQESAGA